MLVGVARLKMMWPGCRCRGCSTRYTEKQFQSGHILFLSCWTLLAVPDRVSDLVSDLVYFHLP